MDKPGGGATALWTAARHGRKRFEKDAWPGNVPRMDADVPWTQMSPRPSRQRESQSAAAPKSASEVPGRRCLDACSSARG